MSGWNISKVGDGRYKVYAGVPVPGTANYGFAVSNGTIDAHHALDVSKLRRERPELFAAVEAFFAGAPPEHQEVEVVDKYGDGDASRRKPYTASQEWQRGLLKFRRLELEMASRGEKGEWETAVRYLWSGTHKTMIEESTLHEALSYIVQHAQDVSVDGLLQVERAYYSGKYRPHSCETLAAQLELLAGASEDGMEDFSELL